MSPCQVTAASSTDAAPKAVCRRSVLQQQAVMHELIIINALVASDKRVHVLCTFAAARNDNACCTESLLKTSSSKQELPLHGASSAPRIPLEPLAACDSGEHFQD